MRMHSSSIWDSHSWRSTFGPVLLAFGMIACGAEGEGEDTESTPAGAAVPANDGAEQSAVVLGAFEETFDGTNFTVHGLDIGSSDGILPSPDGSRDVGAVQQPLLDQLPARTYPSGTISTASSIIALEQASRPITEAAWDTRQCGPRPARGTCVFVKMRNMYPDAQVVNAYFYLQSLTPGPGVRVRVAPIDTAPPNPGLTGPGIPGVRNALWRYGRLVRMTPEASAPGRHLVFTGTATGAFTFRFKGQVIGTLVR